MIDRAELRRLTAGGDVQLVEVLAPAEFAEAHLPGAINIPVAELAAQASSLDRHRPVVVYCWDAL
jgi:rhodanese-related sulfurtransferase